MSMFCSFAFLKLLSIISLVKSGKKPLLFATSKNKKVLIEKNFYIHHNCIVVFVTQSMSKRLFFISTD